MICMVGGTFNMADQKITEMNFLLPLKSLTFETTGGAEFVLKEGMPINTFYGYETNGIYSANSSVTGPKGELMQAGDVVYVDKVWK